MGALLCPPSSLFRFRPLFRGYTTILMLSLLGALAEREGPSTDIVTALSASDAPDEDTPSMTTVGVSTLSLKLTGSWAWTSVVGAMVTIVVCPPPTTSSEEMRLASSKGCELACPTTGVEGVASTLCQCGGVVSVGDPFHLPKHLCTVQTSAMSAGLPVG